MTFWEVPRCKSGGGFLGYLAVQALEETYADSQADEEVTHSHRSSKRQEQFRIPKGSGSHLSPLFFQAGSVLEAEHSIPKSLIQRLTSFEMPMGQREDMALLRFPFQGPHCDNYILQAPWKQ